MSEGAMYDIFVDQDISLRRYDPRNAEQLFALLDANRAYLEPWVGVPRRAPDVPSYRKLLVDLERRQRAGEIVGGSIMYGGQFVGDARFDGNDWGNAGHAVGIAYWIGEEFQGQGIVTRSCKTLVGLAFGTPGIERVEISSAAENARSRRLAERLGFQLEGILRAELKRGDDLHDLAVYSMLRHEWLAL